MNVKLLRSVQKFLLAEPRRFDMQSWVAGEDDDYDVLKPPPCGTACCIAGAAFLLDKKIKSKGAPYKEEVFNAAIGSDAAEALQLEEDEESRLFYVENWPLRFVLAYNSAKTPLQRVKAGIARIDHFVNTNGQE